MTFEDAEKNCERLRALLARTTGRDLIDAVSLERPVDGDARAQFSTLILWAYAFWFEACQPVGNALKAIVRGLSPEDFKRINGACMAIQHLRTVQAHNLLPSQSSDVFHQQQAAIWTLTHGGDPPDWSLCFEEICRLLFDVTEILAANWMRIVSSEPDAEAAKVSLLESIDRELPPHHCDRIIEAEAAILKLAGFNVVAYRNLRLKDWRTYYAMFELAEDGRAALARVIRTDMRATFGGLEGED